MLIDSVGLDPGHVVQARYCVIGSGMGGAAVAQALAAAKQDVLLIEAGAFNLPRSGAEPVTVESVGRSFNMPLTRCIEVGGTSNQWHGICGPLDEIDFEARPYIDGSGWPITLQDLSSYYSAAARMLDIPDEALVRREAVEEQFTERAKQLQFDLSILDRKWVYVRRPPMRWKDTLRRLALSRTLRLIMNAAALELITCADGDRITHLVAGSSTGNTFRVQAEVFVICCGGLESPRLLLNSRQGSQRGIGNLHDQVGRNLMDHPAGHFGKIRFHRSTRAPLYSGLNINAAVGVMVGLMARADVQRRLALPNHYTWVRPSLTVERLDDELMLSFLRVRGVRDLTLRQMLAIVTNPDILYRVLVHRFGVSPKYRYGDLWFMTEQLPNPASRVSLSDTKRDRFGYPIARVNWQLSDRDLAEFHRFVKMLFDAGLRSEQHELARIDDPAIWDRYVASAAHHLGTARMAADPRKGVVDRNLRILDVKNGYVCDASVFATAGSVNPSLTITALALRLADHLLHSPQHGA